LVLLVGIDWADQEHVYCLMDEAGTTLSTGTIEHTAEGLEHFMNAVRARAQDPREVLVAIETSHGPLVGALLEYEFTVYALNPKAVDRSRERFRISGAKSDLRDAWVLATMLRTDRQLYRPIIPDSEDAQELRALTRDRADLVRTRTMLSNQLTTCLKTYFPEFLALFADPDRPVALALLQAYPTRERLQAVSQADLERFLRRHRCPRSRERASAIYQRMRAPGFHIAPPVVRAKARLASTLVAQLQTLAAHIDAYDREIQRVLRLHPDGELYRSLPGAGDTLAARMVGELGDNRDRYQDPSIAQCEAGTAPVTRTSAHTRTVHFRRACIHPLRDTLWQFAFSSMRHCPWARAYYDRARKRGKKHAEAVRMLGNVWLRIIIALRRTSRPYDEAVFLRARSRHAPTAPAIVCG
jgi:transposase